MFQVWVDAKVGDGYWHDEVVTDSKIAAEEAYAAFLADSRYLSSNDACAGVNPL
jgi:hypothetical protein